MCFGIITPAILTNIIILLHIWIKKLKSYMGKILRRKTESNFLRNVVFSFSKSGGCTPPPIRIKITPPLSYRPRLLAIGKLKFRIKPLNYVFLVSLCLSMVRPFLIFRFLGFRFFVFGFFNVANPKSRKNSFLIFRFSGFRF